MTLKSLGGAALTAAAMPFLPAAAQQGQSDSDGVWVVPSNASLQEVLYQWCQKAGWTLVWNSDHAYRTQAQATFKSSFIQAVEKLSSYMQSAIPRLYIKAYSKNKVVVVQNTPAQ